MKNMFFAVMFVASPLVAQEFPAEMPVLREILAKTHELKTASASMAVAPQEERREKRAQLLNDIEKVKGKIQTYGDDSIRYGIYNAELSLLQLLLAFVNADGVR